jgi:hypothetical protein
LPVIGFLLSDKFRAREEIGLQVILAEDEQNHRASPNPVSISHDSSHWIHCGFSCRASVSHVANQSDLSHSLMRL